MKSPMNDLNRGFAVLRLVYGRLPPLLRGPVAAAGGGGVALQPLQEGRGALQAGRKAAGAGDWGDAGVSLVVHLSAVE